MGRQTTRLLQGLIFSIGVAIVIAIPLQPLGPRPEAKLRSKRFLPNCPPSGCRQQDYDPCAKPSCKNGGQCAKLYDSDGYIAGFRCACTCGFYGTYCEKGDSEGCSVGEQFGEFNCRTRSQLDMSCGKAQIRVRRFCNYANDPFCAVTDSNLEYFTYAAKSHCDGLQSCSVNMTDVCAFKSSPNTRYAYQCCPSADIPDPPCRNNPCANGGKCLPEGDSFRCVCADMWAGELCDQRPPCMASERLNCLNGGQCVRGSSGPICVCAPRYFGTYCQIDLNTQFVNLTVTQTGNAKCGSCCSSPCQNGGTCQQTGSTNGDGFICQCKEPFNGPLCQNFKQCGSGFCKNGGTCAEKSDGSKMCICPANFFGLFCQIDMRVHITACLPNPCRYGGVCTPASDSVGGYTCACPHYLTGVNCETSLACNPNPCRNLGTCIIRESDGYSQCNCRSGYLGRLCDLDLVLIIELA